ncbi:protein kinase C delta type-like, partial [Pyxicephalus adspersus]|uniref:protein kinase C delta type-like n=1 Tax=Pyxicephalus adspersus TaxID=30357 RepID=UPI003B599DD7
STHEDGEKPSQSNTSHSSSPVALTAQTFTLHDVLGEGSFGKVMLATDRIQGKQVAMKRLRKRPMMFLPYSSIMAEHNILQLSNQCPFLIHGYAAFQTHSYIYYIMELARGGTLENLISNPQPMETKVVKFITAELVCGLQFLHSKDIIHQDLKPLNILLTNQGHAKIMDFGLSIENASTTYIKSRGGTPGYIAPEMLKHLDYDQGVDWFALGVTLYKMFTKQGPFGDSSSDQIDRLIVTVEPNYKGLSRKQVKILKQLLCKDPDKRLGVHGDIRKHRFFKDIKWEELETGRMPSPLAITMDGIDSLLNNRVELSNKEADKPPVGPFQQLAYKDIGFICPAWAAHYCIQPTQPDI